MLLGKKLMRHSIVVVTQVAAAPSGVSKSYMVLPTWGLSW
jgi:hypothetical protein